MLRVNGLAKRLGDRDVLKHVAFAVEEGEVFGLLGANGAGKSTTVNIIAGLLTADAGTVTLDRWVDNVRLFCTIYDPSTGRYRFDYSIFVAIIIGTLCLAAIAVCLVRAWRENSSPLPH